jgi:flagellar basal body-associated protein FliL
MIWIIAPIAVVAVAVVGLIAWLGVAISPEAGEGADEANDVAEQEAPHYAE